MKQLDAALAGASLVEDSPGPVKICTKTALHRAAVYTTLVYCNVLYMYDARLFNLKCHARGSTQLLASRSQVTGPLGG